MNQGPRYVRLMDKSRGQKSRATVPLRRGDNYLTNPTTCTGKMSTQSRAGNAYCRYGLVFVHTELPAIPPPVVGEATVTKLLRYVTSYFFK
jgi:hypothetical protein